MELSHRDSIDRRTCFCTKRPDGRRITVKVLDFGISKMRDVGVSVSGAATGEGTLLGLLYMSPELAQFLEGRRVGHGRSGASASSSTSSVSGAMPFYGHTLTEVATKIAL